MNHFIRHTQEFGRGLYARELIQPGQVIMECELLVLSPGDTIKVNETDLQYYTFKYNETQDCLVLGDGELFNHDNNPNCIYELVEKDGRKFMRFTAIKKIMPIEQIFIDYQADTKVKVSDYNVNLVG